MEKLAKLGWQKLIIIAAALDIVLGIIFGAIFKAVPAGIIVGVLAAAVTGVIVFALGGGVVAGHLDCGDGSAPREMAFFTM